MTSEETTFFTEILYIFLAQENLLFFALADLTWVRKSTRTAGNGEEVLVFQGIMFDYFLAQQQHATGCFSLRQSTNGGFIKMLLLSGWRARVHAVSPKLSVMKRIDANERNNTIHVLPCVTWSNKSCTAIFLPGERWYSKGWWADYYHAARMRNLETLLLPVIAGTPPVRMPRTFYGSNPEWTQAFLTSTNTPSLRQCECFQIEKTLTQLRAWRQTTNED